MFKCLGKCHNMPRNKQKNMDIPTAIPIASCMAIPIVSCVVVIKVENGLAKVNDTVKCCYKLKPHLPLKWYYGVITTINNNNTCIIKYDTEGFSVTGGGKSVYLYTKK
jgi:hypothetical protein